MSPYFQNCPCWPCQAHFSEGENFTVDTAGEYSGIDQHIAYLSGRVRELETKLDEYHCDYCCDLC